jgi:hypothetical protein
VVLVDVVVVAVLFVVVVVELVGVLLDGVDEVPVRVVGAACVVGVVAVAVEMLASLRVV